MTILESITIGGETFHLKATTLAKLHKNASVKIMVELFDYIKSVANSIEEAKDSSSKDQRKTRKLIEDIEGVLFLVNHRVIELQKALDHTINTISPDQDLIILGNIRNFFGAHLIRLERDLEEAKRSMRANE